MDHPRQTPLHRAGVGADGVWSTLRPSDGEGFLAEQSTPIHGEDQRSEISHKAKRQTRVPRLQRLRMWFNYDLQVGPDEGQCLDYIGFGYGNHVMNVFLHNSQITLSDITSAQAIGDGLRNMI